jgi:hypothetical protein
MVIHVDFLGQQVSCVLTNLLIMRGYIYLPLGKLGCHPVPHALASSSSNMMDCSNPQIPSVCVQNSKYFHITSLYNCNSKCRLHKVKELKYFLSNLASFSKFPRGTKLEVVESIAKIF